MIVFTATSKNTRDVYVGTARESVEEEWADLHAQAEQGASGQFFNQLREHGANGFEVDTWAYAESPSEARESMREAREDLDAQPIKSSRSKAVTRKPVSDQSDSMKALMAVFQEALTDTDAVDEEDALDGLVPEASSAQQDSASRLNESGIDAQTQQSSVSPPATPVDKAQMDAEVGTPTSTPAAVADSSAEPQTDDAKMMARIEAMKAAQAKLLKEREQSPSVASSSGVKTEAPKPAKIASGRTGSAAKEKRIREAIELERERRESIRQVRGRDEYDEMNAVMARVEMRRLATKRSNAEKTKQEAAKKRKLEREKKAAAATLNDGDKGQRAPLVTSESPKRTRTKVKPAASPRAAESKQKAATKTLKLAAGRTGSSAKEKRIKEAIEQEKADRLAKKSAQSATEAAEMAALLARLDERSKKAEKMKRSR